MVGIHRKRDRGFAGVHELDQFAGAADAADEIDALAGARVVDAEHGREQAVLQAVTSSARSDRRPASAATRGHTMAVEIHADVAGASAASASRRAVT